MIWSTHSEAAALVFKARGNQNCLLQRSSMQGDYLLIKTDEYINSLAIYCYPSLSFCIITCTLSVICSYVAAALQDTATSTLRTSLKAICHLNAQCVKMTHCVFISSQFGSILHDAKKTDTVLTQVVECSPNNPRLLNIHQSLNHSS